MGGSIGVARNFYDNSLSDEEGYYSIDGIGKGIHKEEHTGETTLQSGQHRIGNVNPSFLDVPYINRYPFNEFKFIKKLGIGRNSSVVYKAVNLRNEKEKYAVKEVKISEMKKEVFEDFRYELNILSQLSHTSIMKLYSVYDTNGPNSKFFLVLEYIRGGELLNAIIQNEHYTEEDIIHFSYQIVSGIHYLHSRNVIHGNLIPENIVLSNQRFGDRFHNKIKLVGFDFAESLHHNRFPKDHYNLVIDEQFRSPELSTFSQNRGSKASDIWSFGVFLHLLLAGRLPFQDKVVSLNPMTSFTDPTWDKVSFAAKELLSKVLRPEPPDRFTSSDLINNAWIQTDFVLTSQQGKDLPAKSEDISVQNEEQRSLPRKSIGVKPILTLNHNLKALEEFQRKRYFFLEGYRSHQIGGPSLETSQEDISSQDKPTIYRFLSNDFGNSPPKPRSFLKEFRAIDETIADESVNK